MKLSPKLLAFASLFVLGAGSAIGFQVHAQSAQHNTPVAPVQQAAPVPAAQTTQQDPQNTDGETADDAGTAQNSDKSTVDAADTNETDTGSATEVKDVNEVNDVNEVAGGK